MFKKFKGIGLLILANILIMLTLSLTVPLLVNIVLPAFGIDVRGSVDAYMLVWAGVFGFGGAFISLAFSKQFARAMLGERYQVTEPKTRPEEVVFQTVRELAQRLHVDMPEVWIYDAPDPNAFATGPTKNNAMVAVSTGLLENLSEGEVRSVLAHEMGHVWNGDMFTTTVLMGLMNTFVYFISNFIARQLAERNAALGFISYFFLQIVLSFLAMIPICWFSRRREFEADKFSAKAYGPAPMISALEGIQRFVEAAQVKYSTQDALATMKISGNTGGLMRLWATHPPIEERIAALRRLA
jgi:heat shock protein HtpX